MRPNVVLWFSLFYGYEWFVLRTLLTLASFLFFLPSMESPFLQRIPMVGLQHHQTLLLMAPLRLASQPNSMFDHTDKGTSNLPQRNNQWTPLFLSGTTSSASQSKRLNTVAMRFPLVMSMNSPIKSPSVAWDLIAFRLKNAVDATGNALPAFPRFYSFRTFSSRLSHRNLLFIRIWDEMRWLGMFLHFVFV